MKSALSLLGCQFSVQWKAREVDAILVRKFDEARDHKISAVDVVLVPS